MKRRWIVTGGIFVAMLSLVAANTIVALHDFVWIFWSASFLISVGVVAVATVEFTRARKPQ